MKKLTCTLFAIAAMFSAPAFADEPNWHSCDFWNVATPADLKPVFDRESLEYFRSQLTPEELVTARACFEGQLAEYIRVDRILCRWAPDGEYLGEEGYYLQTLATQCMVPYLND